MLLRSLLALAVLAILGCSDEERPLPTPTAAVTSTVIAPGAPVDGTSRPPSPTSQPAQPTITREAGWGDVTGPVLVYKREAPPSVVVAYDIARRRPVWSARMHEDGGFTEVAVTAGGVVLIAERTAYFQDLRGGQLEKLFELQNGSFDIGGAAAAPNGAILAFSIQGDFVPVGTPRPDGTQAVEPRGSILFYDLAARRRLLEVAGTAEIPLVAGAIRWRADGRGVHLHSFTNSERPGAHSAIFLDGSVVQYDVKDWTYVSPDGRQAIHGITSDCMFIGGPEIRLRNLDSGEETVAVHNAERIFTGIDWSPDSREFLFASRPHNPEPGCHPIPEPIHLLLDTSTGLILEITDLESLYRRWYGDQLVWVDCQGRFEPLAAGYLGWPTAFCLDPASRQFAGGILRYRDLEIDASSSFRLYGLVSP